MKVKTVDDALSEWRATLQPNFELEEIAGRAWKIALEAEMVTDAELIAVVPILTAKRQFMPKPAEAIEAIQEMRRKAVRTKSALGYHAYGYPVGPWDEVEPATLSRMASEIVARVTRDMPEARHRDDGYAIAHAEWERLGFSPETEQDRADFEKLRA